MKTSHAAKRQGDFFAEARASPTSQQAERIKGLEGALQNARGFINVQAQHIRDLDARLKALPPLHPKAEF